MSSFVINTTISTPHDGIISDMCFSPSGQTTKLVTVSLDRHFKVWQLGRPDPANGKPVCSPAGVIRLTVVFAVESAPRLMIELGTE